MQKLITQSGQALITLLLFVIISVTITTAAIIVIFVNAKSTTAIAQGNTSKSIAESGIENALLRLLRNPSYTGETLQINGGKAVVTVTIAGNVYTITSNATIQNFQSAVVVTASHSANVMSISSWKEQ